MKKLALLSLILLSSCFLKGQLSEDQYSENPHNANTVSLQENIHKRSIRNTNHKIPKGLVNGDQKTDSTQIATLESLQLLSDGLYKMNYKADYFFDEFSLTGTGNLSMEEFIEKNLDTIPQQGLWACSAFMVNNRKNELFVGRNFDWENIPAMILFTEPDSGYKSVSMVPLDLMLNKEAKSAEENKKLLWAPYFPLEGMNERGLVVIELGVEGEEVNHEGKVSMLSLQLIRLLLDNASCIEESVILLNQYNNSASHRMHFFLADSTGSSAVIEYLDNELVITPNKNPWQVVTNTMVYKQSPKKLRKSCSRYNWIDQYLEANNNALSTVGIRGLLSNVSVSKVYSPQFNITVTTQWSVIYNIREKSIDVYSKRNYRTNYHFNLE